MTPDEFRRIRKAARMTQEQLAQRLGKSRKTVNNWEKGLYSIPDDALNTLTEKGILPEPAPGKPVNALTHPELYNHGAKNNVERNHKHPHWFAGCTLLWYHMTQEQVDYCRSLVTMPEHVMSTKWTPESAIAFCLQFNARPMDRERAEDIARSVGFDVPKREKPIDAYKRDWAQFQQDCPGEGWRLFEELYPQHREHKAVQATGEIDPKLKAAFDAAFNLNPKQQET